MRKAVGESAAACSAWASSAQHGASLIDALNNLVERRQAILPSRHLDSQGLPLRGPACSFRGERAAVAASQLEASETLLVAIVENLCARSLPCVDKALSTALTPLTAETR